MRLVVVAFWKAVYCNCSCVFTDDRPALRHTSSESDDKPLYTSVTSTQRDITLANQ